MFTGIVEEVGTVRAVDPGPPGRLEVAATRVLAGTAAGDSISVNGCCLTVTAGGDGGFACDLMGETLARTTLGALRPGDAVNLERALAAGGRLGGHLVQGHVDAVGEVEAAQDRPGWRLLRVAMPPAVARYVVEKGSVAVDGASLTVIAAGERHFEVGLVPHTLEATVLGGRRAGDRVNLEVDVVAKYVERLLAAETPSPYTEPRSTG